MATRLLVALLITAGVLTYHDTFCDAGPLMALDLGGGSCSSSNTVYILNAVPADHCMALFNLDCSTTPSHVEEADCSFHCKRVNAAMQ